MQSLPILLLVGIKVGMVEIFHLFFLCTNQLVFRSYFDPYLPFSPDDAQYMIA